jgi:hypothetical protein
MAVDAQRIKEVARYQVNDARLGVAREGANRRSGGGVRASSATPRKPAGCAA